MRVKKLLAIDPIFKSSKPQFLGSLCIPAVLTTKTSPFPISAR